MTDFDSVLVQSDYSMVENSCKCGLPVEAGERKAAKPHRDLTYINKVQSEQNKRIYITNKKTGEVFEVNPMKTRVTKLQKRVFSWAHAVKKYQEGGYRLVMLGLTYRDWRDWKPNQIRDYIKKIRYRLGDRLRAYAWVAELQQRGAVHYHVLLIVKKGTFIPKPDESGMWAFGSSNICTAKSVFYICSYVGKEYQKMGFFPKGLRMYSVWIAADFITEIERWVFRLSTLPVWFREIVQKSTRYNGQNWSRNPGGGFEILGEIFQSPYIVEFRNL